MTETSPAIEGWFTTGPEPVLLGSRCTSCASTYFPPTAGFCRNPRCGGDEFETAKLSRRGRVWSYTDAQYQPPPPYVPARDPYEPFALAAVELPEGIVVLGQVAAGYGVGDLEVGREMELVVEPLYTDDSGPRTIWRWSPVAEPVETQPPVVEPVETQPVETTEPVVEPVETQPVETAPPVVEPVETKPVETRLAEVSRQLLRNCTSTTEPVVEPVETKPAETAPPVVEPVETQPVETRPVETREPRP